MYVPEHTYLYQNHIIACVLSSSIAYYFISLKWVTDVNVHLELNWYFLLKRVSKMCFFVAIQNFHYFKSNIALRWHVPLGLHTFRLVMHLRNEDLRV